MTCDRQSFGPAAYDTRRRSVSSAALARKDAIGRPVSSGLPSIPAAAELVHRPDRKIAPPRLAETDSHLGPMLDEPG
jgi:hypothetical protein